MTSRRALRALHIAPVLCWLTAATMVGCVSTRQVQQGETLVDETSIEVHIRMHVAASDSAAWLALEDATVGADSIRGRAISSDVTAWRSLAADGRVRVFKNARQPWIGRNPTMIVLSRDEVELIRWTQIDGTRTAMLLVGVAAWIGVASFLVISGGIGLCC